MLQPTHTMQPSWTHGCDRFQGPASHCLPKGRRLVGLALSAVLQELLHRDVISGETV